MRRFARPLLSALALAFTLVLAPGFARAAENLAPELATPFADLTLAVGAASAPLDLSAHFRDPDVPGPAARITVRLGAETRHIDLALLSDEAPQTVANFLAYLDAGRYAANFFHRSVPGFIIQNGGFFFLNDTTFDAVPTFDPVVNEPGLSNTRGTVAMAKLGGDPDSATSQWFINLADNSANLDAQNGGFTVFARVLGDGMQVADAIAATPRYNASNVHPAWTDIPLTAAFLAREYFIETGIARIAPLSFTATSDDPALVSATLDANGVLSLVPAADRIGSTTVRITATDLEGATLQSSFTVTVTKAPQSITFAPPDDISFGAWLPLQRALSASASSELPVSFEIVSGHATLSGATLTFLKPGEVTVRATQTGDALHAPAPAVERSFTVHPFGDASISLHDTSRVFNGGIQVPGTNVTPWWASYTLTYDGSAQAPTNAGAYAVVATIDDPRVAATPAATATLTIARFPLTLTARGFMLHGSLVPPALELVAIPDVGQVHLPTDPVLRSAVTSGSAPGVYPITIDPIESANYDLTLLPGSFIVQALAATYEAVHPSFGLARVTVARNRRDFTGVLELVDEARPRAIRGVLELPSDLTEARATWTHPDPWRSHHRALQTLNITIRADSTTFTFLYPQSTSSDPSKTVTAARRGPPPGETVAAWAGAYGLHLDDLLPDHPATALPDPLGVGHAAARIDKAGKLSFRGRLPDARPLTAGVPVSDDRAYRLFLRPYGLRNGGYVFGHFFPVAHPTLAGLRSLEPYGLQDLLVWSPPQGPAAVYGGSYEEYGLQLNLAPWLPPLAAKRATATRPAQDAITLVQRIGLPPSPETGSAALGLEYYAPASAAFTQSQIELLPAALSLGSAGKTTAPEEDTSRFRLSITASTGAFSGSFVVTDTVAAPTSANPDRVRQVTRKIPFTGMLRQPHGPAPETGAVHGAGQFVVPALAGSSQTSPTTGEIRLVAP